MIDGLLLLQETHRSGLDLIVQPSHNAPDVNKPESSDPVKNSPQFLLRILNILKICEELGELSYVDDNLVTRFIGKATMPNRLANQADPLEEKITSDDGFYSLWNSVPDSLLLNIFMFLDAPPLLKAAQVCKDWNRVSKDEFLWKDLFCYTYKILKSIPMAPGKSSWLKEFQRLYSHTPMIESEILTEHRDQVLHVSFSHDGTMFSTSCKDGFIKVWHAGYPSRVKYYEDMRDYTWKYTQFSQFNETDTLLLVSGVHFGSHSTSGEIAVFNLEGGFELQCRVLNKPYDIFGTWYNESYLLSGNLYWTGNLTSCSVLWLNKAEQALESEKESVVSKMYKFHNLNASSIRTIMVAQCLDDESDAASVCLHKAESSGESRKRKGPESCNVKDVTVTECSQSKAKRKPNTTGTIKSKEGADSKEASPSLDELCAAIEYNSQYRNAQSTRSDVSVSSEELDEVMSDSECELSSIRCRRQDSGGAPQTIGNKSSYQISGHFPETSITGDTTVNSMCAQASSSCQSSTSSLAPVFRDKYLIYTTGSQTYTPHQIGIKKITAAGAKELIYTLQHDDHSHLLPPPGVPVEPVNIEPLGPDEEFDTADHLIELHGHIIGMALSPEHRYLYVNSRPWPSGYVISEALVPPPIAQEIDIHVIDLCTMQEVGKMHRAHKAYTPNDECFFIFLDVCDEYVSSGAEDKHGYLWDRHYGVCLTRYPHNDVVNCVAFNPKDTEVLVTTSDDNTIKVWRSRNRIAQLKADEADRNRSKTVGEHWAHQQNKQNRKLVLTSNQS